MKGFTIKIDRPKRLPARGYNPAARTGNASGVHRAEKGKGTKYDRARAKDRERRCQDD